MYNIPTDRCEPLTELDDRHSRITMHPSSTIDEETKLSIPRSPKLPDVSTYFCANYED